MAVENQNFFFTYTLPTEATTWDASQSEAHGTYEDQRNNITADWVTRKWWHTGWVWNETYDDPPDNWGLWVGDLDDLTDMVFLPFDRTAHDPFTPLNLQTAPVGLVAFENTNYLALSIARPASTGSTVDTMIHCLVNRTTGAIVDTVSTTNADSPVNNEVPPFVLPTSDDNVFLRFDMSRHSSTGALKWAVIKYDLSTGSVTLPVDYAAVDALIDGVNYVQISKGQVKDTSNTIFMVDSDSGIGEIYEIEIPHSVSASGDLSTSLLVTVAAVSGASKRVQGPYYDSYLDRLVYPIRASSSASDVTYEGIARTDPTTVLWSTTVTPESGPFTLNGFSQLRQSSYSKVNLSGCTCLDVELGQVINVRNGTVHQIARMTNIVRGAQYQLLDMAENRVYLMDTVREDQIDDYFKDTANFPDADHNWEHVDTGNFITFMYAFRSPNDLFYSTSACLLTGISFGEEKDPNYVDFASI